MGAKLHHTIVIVAMCITTMPKQITEGAGSDPCPVSKTTVQIVDRCPETQDDWNDAAARKNCSQYADQCDQPDKLLYHCVINPYVNQTLEVCAYVQNIVLGYCAEYTILGNLIQANFKTNCTAFKQKPCPAFYRSKDAFLYPGCYELVKNSTASSSVSTVSSTTFSSGITGRNTTSPNGDRMKDDDNTEENASGKPLTIALTVVLLVFLLVVLTIVFVWKRKKKNFCGKKFTKNDEKGNENKGHQLEGIPATEEDEKGNENKGHQLEGIPATEEDEKGNENKGHQLEGIPATEEGECMIAPSGQGYDTVRGKKGVVQTEDEEQEYLLNEEPNHEKQECERLLEILNETIEKIVLTRTEDKGNIKEEDILHQIYKNPSFFENESNQNIREKAEKLKALEQYFRREKVSEMTVENEGAIKAESSSENFN